MTDAHSPAQPHDPGADAGWRQSFRSTRRGICVIDADTGLIVSVNPSFAAMHGGKVADFEGRPTTIFLPPGTEPVRPEDAAQGDAPGFVELESQHVRLDGTTFAVHAEAVAPGSRDQGSRSWVTWVEDLTEKQAAEADRRTATAMFEAAFTNAPIGMALVGLDGRFMRVNRALCELTGYTEPELVELTFQQITHPDDLEADLRYVERLLAGEIDRYSMEKRYFTAQGHQIWINLSGSLLRDADGEPMQFVAQIEDISERKRLESSLQRLADHDPLTGLWNRRRFEDELHRQVGRCQRYGERAALLVIDLDNFKPVNDDHGHKAGDDLLVAIAHALRSRLRATDSIARLGGDEFGMILANISPDQAAALAESMRDAAGAAHIAVDDRRIAVTASVGIAFLDEHTRGDLEAMLQADSAMYDAKAAGRDRFIIGSSIPQIAPRQRFRRQPPAPEQATPTVRILHCEDSEAYRRLVFEILGARPGLEVVAAAETADEALALAASEAPDVILLDTSLEPSGAIVARLRAAAPGARIVVLSGLDREATPLGRTADAFVRKAAPFEELVAVLRGGAPTARLATTG